MDTVPSTFEGNTKNTATGATWTGLHVWDDMRAVDYLCSRADVDPARIGFYGLSYGGKTAMRVFRVPTATDPKAPAAAIAWVTGAPSVDIFTIGQTAGALSTTL